jgi:transposase InsO family protein
VHLEVFRKELEHLVSIGVLSRQGTSEWASPTFIIPKKDGRVRWVSDLRALNKVIVRKQYHLPVIQDILKRRKGYAFFSKLDISMQYYTFELDDASKDLCTIATPFGKFKYNRLPMGLKCSPDIAQQVMESILQDIEEAEVYIDDIGVFSETYEKHLAALDRVLEKLRTNGFQVNPLKCEWAVQETDWLGYWLTPKGLKPWKKKIDAVLKMEPPQNMKQLRGFIGAVNYYRDMWPHRSHILAPLTAETGKKKLAWTPAMQTAFEQMKALMAIDAISAYPDHNKPYKIYTDASDYQLGACIMQEQSPGKWMPVAYYSRKLNKAQRNYTTMEKELLSIVMTLKEFRSMLLGAVITIYTDHRNLTFENLQSQRVLRWRNYIEEYSPEIKYIEGPQNSIADTFSRLGRRDTAAQVSEGKSAAAPPVVYSDRPISNEENEEPNRNAVASNAYYSSVLDDREFCECMLALPDEECYLNLPFENVDESPLNLEHMREQQYADESLMKLREKYPRMYQTKEIGSVADLIIYVRPGDDPNTRWRIALPKSMIQKTIEWFHMVTGHPGSKRLRLTLNNKYYHPELRKFCDRYQCASCQKHKLDGKGYGLLPEREIRSEPFEEVAVDLIGPWTIQIRGKPYEFRALTSIDTVTALVEICQIKNKTADHVSRKFAQSWLARYPWPIRCIHDNGGEFTGWEFQRLLEKCHIKDVPTTSRNPQANAICERMHQTVGNILRTLLHENPPKNVSSAKDLIDEALSMAMHAMRASVHTTLGGSPGSLVFNRDMFLNIPLIADWHAITQRREQLVNENLRRANKKRRRFDYAPNQQVLKKLHAPTKLGERTSGPFNIREVHTNGTITIQLRPGVTERINIRRVIPYRENT